MFEYDEGVHNYFQQVVVRCALPDMPSYTMDLQYLCRCGALWTWRKLPRQCLGIVCPRCGHEYGLRRN